MTKVITLTGYFMDTESLSIQKTPFTPLAGAHAHVKGFAGCFLVSF